MASASASVSLSAPTPANTPPSVPNYTLLFTEYEVKINAFSDDNERLVEIFKWASRNFESREKSYIWNYILATLKKHFEIQLERLPFAQRDELLHEKANIVLQFLTDLYEKFENDKVPAVLLAKFKKDLDYWKTISHHIKLRLSLSPDMEKRIKCVVARNIMSLAQPYEVTSGYQTRLERVFSKRFTPLIFLGSGGCKVVYAAIEVASNKVYSVALCRWEKPCGKENIGLTFNPLEKEVSLTLSGRPGILKTFEVQEVDYGQYILQGFVQELMDGDFFDIANALQVGEAFPEITEKVLEKMMLEMLSALVELEQAGIVHKDIRAENLFYRIQDSTLRLGDFGCAKPIKTEKESVYLLIVNKPPEYLQDRASHSHKLDVYSTGFLLYSIYFAKFPLRKSTNMRNKLEFKLFSRILHATNDQKSLEAKCNYDWFPNHPLMDSERGTIFEVMWHMLQNDPEKRYTATQAYEAAKKVFGIAPSEASASSAATKK